MKVWFFVNVLILIVEKEFTIKNRGYRQSWGGDFWEPTSFEGLKGGSPRKKIQFFFRGYPIFGLSFFIAKSCSTLKMGMFEKNTAH